MRSRSRGSGLVSRRKLLLGIGAGLASTGLTSTGAYEATRANRGSNSDAATDPDAYLGIDGYDTVSETSTLTNNSANPMDVTLDSAEDVEFDVGGNGNWASPPVTFSLAVGETIDVGIRWVGDCVDAGSATVQTDAALTEGGSTTVGAISLDREWLIPEAGQIQFNGTVSSAGSSGKYEFDLENTGCEDVTFVGIGINETTTDADFVSGGGSLFNVDTGDELVTDRIPVDSSDPTSDTRRDMNPNVTLHRNDTVTFEFDKFQRSGSGKPNVDMRGEDVRITLYLSDGSTATEKLCLGSCDF